GRKQKAESRKQKAESRRQKAEGRRQKAESVSHCLLPTAYCLLADCRRHRHGLRPGRVANLFGARLITNRRIDRDRIPTEACRHRDGEGEAYTSFVNVDQVF